MAPTEAVASRVGRGPGSGAWSCSGQCVLAPWVSFVAVEGDVHLPGLEHVGVPVMGLGDLLFQGLIALLARGGRASLSSAWMRSVSMVVVPGVLTGVDLGLMDPATECLGVDAELLAYLVEDSALRSGGVFESIKGQSDRLLA